MIVLLNGDVHISDSSGGDCVNVVSVIISIVGIIVTYTSDHQRHSIKVIQITDFNQVALSHHNI
jgi:hypothetical protein